MDANKLVRVEKKSMNTLNGLVKHYKPDKGELIINVWM